jgi:hypothetical protein
MTDKEVMQMALDVLANNRHALPIKEVIEALRAALAQQQKPVAWLDSLDRSQPHAVTGFQYLTVSQIARGEQHKYIPVYAAPQREWVGLTDEPAAWADKADTDREGHDFWVSRQQPAKNGVPLYTAPPQREWQGLTDDEVAKAWCKSKGEMLFRLEPFARAIEAKLKEKNCE